MKKIIYMLMLVTILIPVTFLADENQSLDTYFQNYAKDNDINGYVIVSSPNENGYNILYKGQLTNDSSKSFNEDSIFDIGSISKLFTTTAIFKLQESNSLNINDSISMYLDVPSDKENITISQLLSHTSGIYVDENPDKSVSKEDELNRILNSPLQFEPGTNYKYSNSGFTLLAAIIESVSGMSYEDYITQNIINYDNLTSTGFPTSSYLNSDNAITGNMDGVSYGKVTDFPFSWYSKGYTDILTTPSDLTMFANSLISGKILSQDSLKQMADKQIDLNGYYWTNGLEAYDYPQSTYIGHSGIWYGGNSSLYYREKDNILITVLTDDLYLNSYYPSKALAKDFFNTYAINDLKDYETVETKLYMTSDISQAQTKLSGTVKTSGIVANHLSLILIVLILININLIIIVLIIIKRLLQKR